jgi:hypothetical protein
LSWQLNEVTEYGNRSPLNMIMGRFGGGIGDTTPGFGYLTAATVTISAILTAIMTYARHARRTRLRRTPLQVAYLAWRH